MGDAPFLLEAIFGSFLPHRLHMRLAGVVDDYASDDTLPHAQATAVHEHMHFFQTLFTGYGHIAWDSHRQMTSYIVSEWLKLPSAPDGRRRLPLAHSARLSPRHMQAAFISYQTTLETINLGRARFWLEIPDITLSDLGSRLLPHQWAANPTVTIGGQSHTLQGKEIIEGHAQFIEATFLEEWHGISRQDAWDRSSLPKTYYVALDWFLEQCGESRYTEFPFVCDLALQTSWHPPLPRTEEEWRVSHPAWRFIRLTEALREMNDLALGDPAEWPNKYERFTSTILSASGFLSLDQIFSERLAAFSRKEQLLHFEKLMQAGIKFRERIPWCGGNPVVDKDLWHHMSSTLQAPIVEIEGRLGGFGLSEAQINNVEAVMELQYQALASQIFGDFSSAAMQDQALECAFAKFNIPQGCEFQRTHNCTGRYKPTDGPPHPVKQTEDGTLNGCYFEMLLNTAGLRSTDIDLDSSARLPSDKELKELDEHNH